jgi:hypothetical protein
MKIDLFGAIVPNESLGGLRLRTYVSEISDLVVGLGVSKIGAYELKSPFEARYYFDDSSVQCSVDIRNGKIFKLIATNNYKGMFEQKIQVGMLVHNAISLDPRIYYSEPEECLFCSGVQGILLSLPIIDPDPFAVSSLRISSIVVYAIEIETSIGQEGNW